MTEKIEFKDKKISKEDLDSQKFTTTKNICY